MSCLTRPFDNKLVSNLQIMTPQCSPKLLSRSLIKICSERLRNSVNTVEFLIATAATMTQHFWHFSCSFYAVLELTQYCISDKNDKYKE